MGDPLLILGAQASRRRTGQEVRGSLSFFRREEIRERE